MSELVNVKMESEKKEKAQKLNEYGVYITPVTLAKYMNELGKKKKAKQDKVRKRE